MTAPSVTVLGCAGTFPGPGEACSGYLVRSPDAVTVLDLGPGTLANLQRHVAVGEVDAVVLTHEHPDHWLDLPILRNAMKHVLGLSGLAVYGPVGVRAKAEALGGQVVMPRTPVPGMGWFLYFKDTEGNILGLWQSDPAAA